jgi:drug/metabolite transporter (DMT)-like permease
VTSSNVVHPPPRELALGAAYAVLAAIGFSAKSVLAKIIYAQDRALDPIGLISLRMLFSLPFFLVIAAWTQRDEGKPSLTRREGLFVVGLGLIGYYFAAVLDFWGLVYLSAGLERLVLYLYPTLVLLLLAVTERRPVGGREAIGLLLSYAGIAAAVGGEVALAGEHLTLGVILVSASAAAFAVFMVGSARLLPRIGSVRFTSYAMIAACVATLGHFAATHAGLVPRASPKVYGLIAAMALCSTVIPVFLMTASVRRLGATRSSTIGTIGPVSTLVFGYVALGEALTAVQWAGAALVIGGVVIASRQRAR